MKRECHQELYQITRVQILNILLWAGARVSARAFDVSVKLVFTNVILNPVFYGLCRSNYRKGYLYVIHLVGHYVSCGLLGRPGGGYMVLRVQVRSLLGPDLV